MDRLRELFALVEVNGTTMANAHIASSGSQLFFAGAHRMPLNK